MQFEFESKYFDCVTTLKLLIPSENVPFVVQKYRNLVSDVYLMSWFNNSNKRKPSRKDEYIFTFLFCQCMKVDYKRMSVLCKKYY